MASRYMVKDGKPIDRGDVLSNRVTTSGKANPHVTSSVASPTRYATNAAIRKPGNKPNELTF